MHMTRYNVEIGIADCDERLAEILFLNTCSTQKTAVRSAVKALLIMSERIFLFAMMKFPPKSIVSLTSWNGENKYSAALTHCNPKSCVSAVYRRIKVQLPAVNRSRAEPFL
jgi:hypothetical protein